jgi:hypothetical protein
MKQLLLCSDLDRTLIPNGSAPESAQARPLFNRLATYPKLRLTYVTGRDKRLVEQAIETFNLPDPEFVIGDVGTTLYHLIGGQWISNRRWQKRIGRDWQGYSHEDITSWLHEIETDGFRLQPPEKQNRFKISYFTEPSINPQSLKKRITEIFYRHGIAANLIWSLDEADQRGLLDVLPVRANKLEAIRFLMTEEKVDESRVVFAGDSGNDLDVLASGLKAIVVNNAAADIEQQALDKLSARGNADRLYKARGGWRGMNGNYAAGVLEGVFHFFPVTADWLQ